MEIGDVLHNIRKEQGLSQEVFGAMYGDRSQVDISRIENGSIQPDKELLADIAVATGDPVLTACLLGSPIAAYMERLKTRYLQ